ncbi:uncharacterized protein LOC128677671 [Plodia interpunctella]|uniref:uncharacterized protein LOC128677671 n=1 Tax=Plodia interpunctella TaxID=58824 RepID=UPI0023688333|nr:uncharacterized protein LOC128677671 [Plodia interpunctella]
MTNFRQILLALATLQWAGVVTCTPLLQGVKITRDFNIDFKPFQFRPISYIMEKWGPFGAFGKKYAIAKRDLDAVNITPPPLQVSGVSSVGPAFASPAPAPVVEVTPDLPPPPVNIPPIPVLSSIPPTAISNDIFQDVIPVAPVGNRVIGPDFISNRLTGLNTDIRMPLPQINNPTPVFDNTPLRVNLLPPVVPPVPQTNIQAPAEQPPPETPSRGGVIARMFGEFILQLISRIITNARSSFSQLSSRVQ